MVVGAGVTFVVWIDNRGTGELYAARVDADGTPLDGAGFLVAADVARDAEPAVSFDGTNFLVVYRFGPFRDHELRGVRISPAGAVLDPGGFLIHDGLERSLSDVHVAFDGRNHLVVWGSWYPYEEVIHATRVTPDATVLDEPIAIDPGEMLSWPMSVAFDGSNFLVVARRSYHDRHTIDAIRVSPNGEVLGSVQVRSVRHEIRVEADVASDGTNHLVVWSETVGIEATARSDVYGARVSADGVLLDAPIPLATGGHRETQPSVTANGNYLVVWRDERTGFGSYDVYATRVTGTGRAIDGEGIPIAAGSAPDLSPSVAAGPGDGFSVGYQRFVPEQPLATPRAFVRRVAPK
jgi:hypothetical protein